MIGESILDLHETSATDKSIKSYEYDEYQLITGTQLNSAGQITITIENQDHFLHLRNSYLLMIEGIVLKADSARYADGDLVAGQVSPLLDLASYSSTFQKGCGLVKGSFPDINISAAANLDFIQDGDKKSKSKR